MPLRNTFNLLCITTLLTLTSTVTFTGTYVPGASAVQSTTYPFTGTAGNQVAQFRFIYTLPTSVPQLLMIVKTTNTAPTGSELLLSSYEHANPSSSVNYDFEHANTGQPQYVQLSPPPSNLYIFIVNFNQQLGVSYSIIVTEQLSYSTNLCLFGNVPPGTIYCSSCNNNAYAGSFCDIPVSQMSNNVTYSLPLQSFGSSQGSFGATTIPGSSSQITLYFTATSNNIVNAIEFKLYSSEVAGIMNYAPTGGLNALTQPNIQYSIKINSGGSDVSVSFLNFNNYATTINVWYTVASSTNVLLIVLAVLGGVLFVGLVIVAICMVRRMRSNDQQRVNPLSAVMGSRTSVIRVGDNDLSVQEIQTYFPGVLCRLVFPQEEPSTQNLVASPGNSAGVDRDCVICLCPIANAEIIKATYCRHLFHALCLNKWFEKQRNCPYCREQYNKKSTVQHYQTLLSLSHKNMLMGVDLVTEIIHSKQIKSNLVIEDIKQ